LKDKKGKALKEEEKDGKRSVFGFVSYVMDPVTFKSKSKGFSVNLVTDLSVTSLLTLSLHGNHPSHIHLMTSPFPKIPVLLVTSSLGYNKWLYDIKVFEHIVNDLL
jgi:hypothetical protein